MGVLMYEVQKFQLGLGEPPNTDSERSPRFS